MIELPDYECDGCTCCRQAYCFPGRRVLVDGADTQTIWGDCGIGGEGTYFEGQSTCPCTEPLG